MSQVKKPKFWRSLAERENTEDFRAQSQREFFAKADEGPTTPGRRRFLQLMGASLALSGCWQEDRLLPQTKRPDGYIPGKPQYFATAMELGGVAVGLLGRSYDGRPIKVEGNPEHSGSRGGTTALHQAAVLELYDPDRSAGVARYAGGKRESASWVEFDEGFLKAAAGEGFAVLADGSSSATLAFLKEKLTTRAPKALWFDYAPINRDNERAGAKLAFGRVVRSHYRLTQADIIVTFDADIFDEHPNGLVHSRDFAARRTPEAGNMSRLYSVESSFTATGGAADHRLPLRSSLLKAALAYLDASISGQIAGAAAGAQAAPAAQFLNHAETKKFLDTVAKDLVAHQGRSLVVVGPGQPAEAHALAHRLNQVLGNHGKTVVFTEEVESEREGFTAQLGQLVKAIDAGQVKTLLILGGNPAYDAPADLNFPAALAKLGMSAHASLYEDETSQLCKFHAPLAHWLESWNDARAWDGTVSLAQPLIAPLYGGRSAIELVANLVGDKLSPVELIRRTHEGQIAGEPLWKRSVHDGFIPGTEFKTVEVEVTKPQITFQPAELTGVEAGQDLEVVFAADTKLYDGRFANLGWLQELPDLVGKLTWDNAVFIGPATAKALGVTDGDMVSLSVGNSSLEIPVLLTPGQAHGSVKVALGYGRTAAGQIGGSKAHGVAPVGANTYVLRTTQALDFTTGASLKKTGKWTKLATTQDKHSIDDLGAEEIQGRLPTIVREGTVSEFKEHPDFAKHRIHHPPLLSLWKPPVSYEGHRWGMTIDLNKCLGCGTCTIACQAENNIPVVGKERVLFGREMHWIRVDRYYKGDPDNPGMAQQPLLCHHCENAPCEQVCPVGATLHSAEGLNDMTYNRCIGTRYCANNCPYKVRRFNYFNFHMDMKKKENQVKGMVFNPEVTVRFRGVMEKCSFCVQRIQEVKIEAKNHRRKIKDGELQAACQQACPSDAIQFGDLNDTSSKVRKAQDLPRSYALLGQLNVRPRLLYLAKVTNPHPDLEPKAEADGHGSHHG